MKREVTFCDTNGCKKFDTRVCPLCRRDHCDEHARPISVNLVVGATAILAPWTKVCAPCGEWLPQYIGSMPTRERTADLVYAAHFTILKRALDEILPLLSAQIAAAALEKP